MKYRWLAIISLLCGGVALWIGSINLMTFFTNAAIVFAVLETAKEVGLENH